MISSTLLLIAKQAPLHALLNFGQVTVTVLYLIQLNCTMPRSRSKLVQIDICRQESSSSLHYDPHNNYLCVIKGTKRVRLYTPAASPALQMKPFWGQSANHSTEQAERSNIASPPKEDIMQHESSFELQVAFLCKHVCSKSCMTQAHPVFDFAWQYLFALDLEILLLKDLQDRRPWMCRPVMSFSSQKGIGTK